MQLSAQLKKNTLWSIIDLGLYPMMMILSTPYFIGKLGMEQYGLWMMASTLYQFMFLFNFGLADSTIQTISSKKALNDEATIKENVQAIWTQSILLALLVMTIGFILSNSDIFILWFHIPPTLHEITYNIIILALCSAGLKLCEMVLLSIPKGFERFDIAARLSIVSKNSIILSSILVLYFQGGLYEIFLCTVLLNVLNIIIQLIVIKRLHSFLNFFPNHLLLKTQRNQFWYWLQSSVGLAGFLSDRFIVGYLTNLPTLGAYSIATMIGSQLHNIISAIGNFTFPRVSHIHSIGENIEPVFKKSMYTLMFLAWLLILFLLVAGEPFLKLWLGHEKYYLSANYIYLYLVYISFLCISIIPFQVNNALGMPKFNAMFESCLRTVHVAGMFIGFYLYNVEGIIIGIILGTITLNMSGFFLFTSNTFKALKIRDNILILLPSMAFIPFIFRNNYIVKLLAVGIFIPSIYLIYRSPLLKYFWKK